VAVDSRHQGNGLGAAMLKYLITKALEVAEIVGVRLVVVHAKDEQADGVYRHHGFIESPIDALHEQTTIRPAHRDAPYSHLIASPASTRKGQW
jgi:GNAT superfamily N-acetyltransferase